MTCLDERQTVSEALTSLRANDVGERIVYFYVVDTEGRLVEVLPVRRLHTAPEATPLSALMVVNRQRQVVDVDVFTEEDFLPDQPTQAAVVFETLGFRISQVRGASPLRAFRFRFPWLLATIASGLACAVLVSVFLLTLARSLALAFLLTLVVALGESVSIQSMTVSIQSLQLGPPTWRWCCGWGQARRQ